MSANATLLPQHERLIAGSAITPEVARARGYRSASTADELKALGFSRLQRSSLPALVLPIWGVDGKVSGHQIRADSPREDDRGRKVKYETPARTRMQLDVPPTARAAILDPAIPLWITEGLRKADAAVSAGVCCLGLLGVWCWRGKNSQGGKVALADFEGVALEGRRVYLCFDSDVVVKPEVHAALRRLHAFLESRGAKALVARLPDGPDGAKVGLDDYLAAAADGPGPAIARLAREATPFLPSVPAPKAVAEDGRPTIVVGKQIGVMVDAALIALLAPHARPIYVASGALARISFTTGTPRVEPLPQAQLKRLLSDRIAWTVVTDDGIKPALPPREVVEALESEPSLPFPALEGVIVAPTMRPDGTVLTDPGYDGASRLFYQPAPGVLFPPVPESPTLDDARVALRALHEPFVDFPFRDAASTSTALALVLTVLGRGAFSGASPLFLIRATNAGTGKQLLAELVSTIATGGPPPTFAAPREDAEWEKKLVAHVREGDRFTVIDEAKHLDSPVLAHAVTQEFLTGRILGLSENVRGRVPVLASCGNQTTFAHDFGRRVLPIDLDAKRSDPERRSGFSIANVSAWCLRERTRLVVAALTSLRAYVLAGRPDQSLCSMGSFEGWSGLIRSTLVWSGLTDPLEGQDRARAESDVGADANLMLLRAWHEATHEPMTSWQIADIANLRGAAGLVHPKLHALLLALDDRQKDTLKPERLGYAFRRLRNKIVANLVLRGVAQDDGDHRIHWQVEKLVLTEAKNKPGALEFSSPGAWDSGRE